MPSQRNEIQFYYLTIKTKKLTMGEFLIAVLILIVIVIIAMRYYGKKADKLEQRSKEILSSLSDFTETESYFSFTTKYGGAISFDSKRRKICFINKQFTPFVYDYKDILKSELILDGHTELSRSTASTAGRAVLGGIIAGGAGAIIGGLSGKQKEKTKIYTIDLKVFVNDTSNPVHSINFFDAGPNGMEKKSGDDKIYKIFYDPAEKWHGIISALIQQGDDLKEKKSVPTVSTPASSTPTVSTSFPSVADELIKLKSLLDAGALTEEEFEEQKRRLLEKYH